MGKIKGLINKIPKKKMIDVNKSLKDIYSSKPLVKLYQQFLFKKFKKYKLLYEESLVCDRNIEFTEMENTWGYKNIKILLKEKNDYIFELEQELIKLKKSISLSNDIDNVKKQKQTPTLVKVEFPEQLNTLFNKIKETEHLLYSQSEQFKNIEIKWEKKECEYKKTISELESKISHYQSIETKLIPYEIFINVEAMQKLELESINLKTVIGKLEQKIFFLEKEIKHQSQEKNDLLVAHKLLKDLLNTTENNQNTLQGDQYIIEEIKSMSQAFEKTQLENKKLRNQIEYLHKRNRDFEIKLVEIQTKAKITEKMLNLIEEHNRKYLALKETVELEKQNHQKKYGTIEHELETKTTQLQELNTTLKTYKQDLLNMQALLEKKTNEYFDQLNQIKILKDTIIENEKKIIEFKSIIKIYEESQNENTAIIDLQIQIQNLKEYVYCPLCKSNIKNHIINKCMHCFCEECLEHRLKTRNRNCPKCNQEYSKNDIKKIYL